MAKIYKFKNVKHSVTVKIIKYTDTFPDGEILVENTEYKGLVYKTTFNALEEVKDD